MLVTQHFISNQNLTLELGGPDLVWRYRMISTTFAFTAGFGFGFERSIVNLSKYPPWVVADFNSKFAREQQIQESNKNQ